MKQIQFFTCSACAYETCNRSDIANHKKKCDDRATIDTLLCDVVPNDPKIEETFEHMIQGEFRKSRIIDTFMRSRPGMGLLPPPALSQRMGSIMSYMRSQEVDFFLSKYFNEATTIEDIFVIMARLNFGDLTHDMNKVIWKIVVDGQETEFCLFLDMWMPDIRKMDDVKDRILLPLRYIVDTMVVEDNFHKHPNVKKILWEGDVFPKEWWNKMDYGQVWARIKKYLPRVEYAIPKRL
jgi:hypothetical protein